MGALGQTPVAEDRRDLVPWQALASGGANRDAPVLPAVEAEVIPRLRLAHRIPDAGGAGPVPTGHDVAALSRLLLTHDIAAASAFVEALRQDGVTVERVFLDLLAPTARHLGNFWAEDVCDFATVTIGMVHLRRLARDHTLDFLRDRQLRLANRRILLAPLPGGQHMFGVQMLAEFFRRAGWDVHCTCFAKASDLRRVVRRDVFHVIGLSAGHTDQIDSLAGLIRALRRDSPNRRLGVMIGGPLILERPEQVALVGADATAVDARQAPLQAERLLAMMAARG